MSDTWTIGELAERAAGTLSPASSQRPNGRVRDVPNERLIRWYTTIGLLDPPLTRRGRVALYGRRHLLQLIAVKRRQADGRSIAVIQAELAGATDATLEAIARIPAADDDRHHPAPAVAADGPRPTGPGDHDAPASDASLATPERRRFWAEPPGPPPAVAAEATPGAPHPLTPPPLAPLPHPVVPGPEALDAAIAPPLPPAAPAAHDGDPHAGSHLAGLLHGVRLAPGVTLLVEGRPPGPGDITALRRAAAPLLATLRERGLTGFPGSRAPDSGLDRSPSEGMQA